MARLFLSATEALAKVAFTDRSLDKSGFHRSKPWRRSLLLTETLTNMAFTDRSPGEAGLFTKAYRGILQGFTRSNQHADP